MNVVGSSDIDGIGLAMGRWAVVVVGAVSVAGVAVIAVMVGVMGGMWARAELSGVAVPESPVWSSSVSGKDRPAWIATRFEGWNWAIYVWYRHG